MLRSPHLRAIAGIVLLSSFVTALSGWQMKAIAQQALPGKNALAVFFGAFSAWVGALCLMTQLLFTAGILRRLGIGQVLLLLPLGLLAGSGGLLLVGSLAAAVLLRGVDKVLRYSIDRPAVELLYLPVSPPVKLPAKSFIDTVVWRAGDGLAGLAVLGFTSFAGMGPVAFSYVNLPLIGLWLLLAHRVHRGYVSTLEQTLQQHRLDTERADTPVLDRDTTDLLASHLGAVDPSGDPVRAGRDGARPLRRGGPPGATRAAGAPRGAGAPAGAAHHERGRRPLRAQAGGGACCDDPDLEVRTEALLYLARHSDFDPVARVQDFSDFPDFSVRAALVAVLARLGGERLEAARPVFELMAAEAGPDGRRTRLEAARLAERMALPFDDAVLQLLLDEDDEVAATALRAVARHGPTPFVDALATRLATPALATAAADALATAGTPAVEPLARLLADARAEPVCRRLAADVLARVGGPDAEAALLDRLLDADGALRLRVLGGLCALQEKHGALAVEDVALEAALGAEILGHYRSYQVLGSVVGGDPEHAPIAGALRAAMKEELERIFRLLDLMHPARDFRSAWVGLQSRDRVIHDQALDLLESLLKPGMKALLVPLVDPEIREEQRLRLAERLVGAAVDGPEAAVRALIGTGDPWLRSCAAYAIGALALHRLEPQLAEWANDPDPLLRETVRQARARLAESAPPA